MLLKRSLTHALTALLLLVVIATFAPAARAGSYTVPFCDQSMFWSTAGWTHTTTTGAGAYFWSDDFCNNGHVHHFFDSFMIPAGASDDWTFEAPTGTYLTQFDIRHSAVPRTAGAMAAIWSWQQDGSRSLTAAAYAGGSLGNASYYFPLSGSKVIKLRNSLLCQEGANCAGRDANNNYGNDEWWSGAVVHLADPSLPTFTSVTGEGWKAEPADGQNPIDIEAADTGSGVREFRFYVDGILNASTSGWCIAEQPVPCPATSTEHFALDTTRLSEGAHNVDLRIVDWSLNEQVKHLDITVRRAPVANEAGTSGPVAVTDTSWSSSNVPAVGDHLQGSQGAWSGSGLSYAYQWFRCDADGTNCVEIPGATAIGYTPTSADVGHALQFCVTASNSGGSATSCSPATAAVVASHPSTGGGTTATTADPVERPGETTKPSSGTGSTTTTSQPADRGAPNGSPAADRVVLTALANNRSSTIKTKFGKRVPISGKLVGPSGAPIANAVLEVQTKTALPGAAVAAAGKVVTGSDGRFTYVAPAGPSRVVRIAYRSHSADTSFADTSDVTLLVSAGVTIKATPKRVRNRHATVFTGQLLGKPITKRGVVVDLQVFFRNKWRTFGAPRTNRAGKYRFRYRFMAGAATWKFRARVRRETSYPYTEGYSARTVKVKVVN